MNLKCIFDSLYYNQKTTKFYYQSSPAKEGIYHKANGIYIQRDDQFQMFGLMKVNSKTNVTPNSSAIVSEGQVRKLLKNPSFWKDNLQNYEELLRDLTDKFKVAVETLIEPSLRDLKFTPELEILTPQSSSTLVLDVANKFSTVEIVDANGRHLALKVRARQAFDKSANRDPEFYVDKERFFSDLGKRESVSAVEKKYAKVLEVIGESLERKGYLEAKALNRRDVVGFSDYIVNMFESPKGMVGSRSVVIILDDIMTTGKTLKMLKWEESLTFYGALFVSARDSETGKKVIDIPWLRMEKEQ